MNKTLTVNVDGYDVRVTGDFQPAERMTLEYPGCDASFEFERFSFVDDDGRTVHHTDTDHELVKLISEGIDDAVVDAIEVNEYLARCERERPEYDDEFNRAFTDAELSRWEPDTGPHF